MSDPLWRTREGFELAPRDMSTSHLLAAIHMIERSRMQNLIHLGLHDDMSNDALVDYYSKWPEAYDALCSEAERRYLIRRGTPQKKLKGRHQ